MKLTYRYSDDIRQIYRGNDYIGYVDESNILWLFDTLGYAEAIRPVSYMKEAFDIIRSMSSSQVTKPASPPTERTIA